MRSKTLPVLLAVATATLVPWAPASGQGEQQGPTATCRGVPATHVGTEAEPLRTTDDDDVVVTNGAQRVRTGPGDDVVCVTGTLPSDVRPGAGDDLVDATAYGGSELFATFVGAPGDADTFLGGDQHDDVTLTGRDTADATFAMTAGAGDDSLYVAPVFAGEVEATFEDGTDQAWFSSRSAGARLDGGDGQDQLTAQCSGCALLVVDLDAGTHFVAEEHGTAVGFEDANVSGVPGEASPPIAVSVIGTAGSNRIGVDGCWVQVEAGAGDDRVTHSDVPTAAPCEEGRYRLFGEAGADVLGGDVWDDVLRGGPGHDTNNGRAGFDRCRAEVERSCER